ncbi:MAG: hypothetical protein R2761_04810 [Acidimicrobiales bacterium]
MPTSEFVYPSPAGPSSGGRFPVYIAAYVRLSFSEEVELNGWIGEETMVGESKKNFRQMTVSASVGGDACKLNFGLRRVRALPVSGLVMGQPVTGQATVAGGAVDFEGMAGQEKLKYRVDVGGRCSTFGRDLGIHVVYQAFYSEIMGSIDRIPDAVMVGLLLPMALRQRDTAYI